MNPTVRAMVCALLPLLAATPATAQGQPSADAIYTGGDIVTVNELQPQAEAIAVKDGLIVAVGYRDEVMKLKGAKTRVVDLGGNTLVPGFVDPHGHVFNTGIQAISANLLPRPDGEVNDIAEMQAALKAWAEQNQKTHRQVRLDCRFRLRRCTTEGTAAPHPRRSGPRFRASCPSSSSTSPVIWAR